MGQTWNHVAPDVALGQYLVAGQICGVCPQLGYFVGWVPVVVKVVQIIVIVLAWMLCQIFLLTQGLLVKDGHCRQNPVLSSAKHLDGLVFKGRFHLAAIQLYPNHEIIGGGASVFLYDVMEQIQIGISMGDKARGKVVRVLPNLPHELTQFGALAGLGVHLPYSGPNGAFIGRHIPGAIVVYEPDDAFRQIGPTALVGVVASTLGTQRHLGLYHGIIVIQQAALGDVKALTIGGGGPRESGKGKVPVFAGRRSVVTLNRSSRLRGLGGLGGLQAAAEAGEQGQGEKSGCERENGSKSHGAPPFRGDFTDNETNYIEGFSSVRDTFLMASILLIDVANHLGICSKNRCGVYSDAIHNL